MTMSKQGGALTAVTQAVEAIIHSGLRDAEISCEQDSCVTFRVPETVSTQKVSVFLYDVHEDLDVRLGEARGVDEGAGCWRPSRMFLRFSYLITCWRRANDEGAMEVVENAPDGAGPLPGKESPALQLPQIVLDALLRNRTLKEIPGAFCRVLPPSESLDALGQFWQALKGNNPRLCISYAVTVPVEVPVSSAGKAEAVWPVLKSTSIVDIDTPIRAAWDVALTAVESRYGALIYRLPPVFGLGAEGSDVDIVPVRAALDGLHGAFGSLKVPLTQLLSAIVAEAGIGGGTPESLENTGGLSAAELSRPAFNTWLKASIAKSRDAKTVAPAPDVADRALIESLGLDGTEHAVASWFGDVLVPRYQNQCPPRLAVRAAGVRRSVSKKQADPFAMLAVLLLASCRDPLQIVATMAFLSAWWRDAGTA